MAQENPPQSATLTDAVRVGFALSPSDPFWVQVREAAKQRALELGVDLIRLPVLPPTAPGEAYLALLEDLRASEVRALISHVMPRAALTAILDDGMPIILAEETTLTHPLLVSVRGLEQAAELAADSLAQRLGGQANLLLVGALEEHLETTRTRLQGFRTVMARYPLIHCAHFPTLWRYDEVREQLLDEADDLRLIFPSGHVDAIFGLSDPMALAARDALRGIGLADERTLVAGINGDPLAIAAIEAGSFHATVETDPQDIGSRLVDFALRAARGESLPDHFPYRLQLVTSENVSQVAARRLVAIADLPSRLVDVNRRQEEERLRQLRASIEMNRNLGAILEWKDLSRALAEVIRNRYGYDRVQLYRWSADDQCLILAAGNEPDDGFRTLVSTNEAGILAEALLRNKATYVPDTHASRRHRIDPSWPETRARVVLPVRFGGKTLGVIDLHSHQRSVRTQVELDALQTLADQLGGAIHNALLYEEALEARAEAEESNRARARLVANLSFGLRTPLNVILGYSQTALAEPNLYGAPLPSGLAQDLRLIHQSGADLLRLINDLLDLAQAESGTLPLYPEWIDPRSFLAELFRSAERAMNSTPEVEWKLQLPTSLPPLYVDPVRLRSVMLDLLGNAAHFTSNGAVRMGAAANDANLRLWVEDTGIGIAPAQLAGLTATADGASAPHTDAQRPAAGLGLGVARLLVRLMGGRLQITSRVGEGTLCQVVLPLRAGESEAVAELSDDVPMSPDPYRLGSDRATMLVQRGVAYIEASYATPFGRNDLALVLGVSPAYVSRIFQRELGLSPWEYLTRVRIENACRLLLEPSTRTVAEVALKVGFADPAYFTRVFHRLTGKAPQAYRAQSGATDDLHLRQSLEPQDSL